MVFWTKFAQIGYSLSKAEKINIIIEINILNLDLVLNLILKQQLGFFEQVCLKTIEKWPNVKFSED